MGTPDDPSADLSAHDVLRHRKISARRKEIYPRWRRLMIPARQPSTLIPSSVVDDDRRYWNPGALFAERAVAYWRRPRKSPLMAAAALTLAGGGILIVVALAIYSRV
ncbi:MAG: hypothetical protein ACRDV3_03065 [Acidothermaceae bacterium]